MNALIFVRLIILLGIFTGFVFAQERAESSTEKQILLNVTVVNKDKEAITDLKAEHFRLYENNKPLEISYFSHENSPLSVGILIDASPSMGDKTDFAREGVLAFIERSNPANEYFLAAFSQNVEVLSQFAEADKVRDIVRASPYFTKGRNNSMLYDAIVLGIENLSKAKNRKRVLLIFADGNDNKSKKNYKDVEKIIKEKNIDVYFVNFATLIDFATKQEFANHSPLENLDEIFAGSVISAGNFGLGPNINRANRQILFHSKLYSPYDLYILILSELAKSLQNQYTVGFKPNLTDSENKWRKIEVKLELEKETSKKIGATSVWHRKGYYPLSELVTGN